MKPSAPDFSKLQPHFTNQTHAEILCCRNLVEDGKLSDKAVRHWIKFKKETAKKNSARTETELKKIKELAKKLNQSFQTYNKAIGHDSHARHERTKGVEFIIQKIKTDSFYWIYYFCYELFESEAGSAFLSEIISQLKQTNSEAFEFFCYRIAYFIAHTRSSGESVVPVNHQNSSSINKLLCFLVTTDFGKQWINWISDTNINKISLGLRENLFAAIATENQHKEIKWQSAQNHVRYLEYKNKVSGTLAYPIRGSILSEEIKSLDYEEKAYSDELALLLEGKDPLPAQLFAWHFPHTVQSPAYQKEKTDQGARFFQWLMREPGCTLLKGFIIYDRYTMPALSAALTDSIRQGLVVYDVIHQEREIAKNQLEFWATKLSESKHPEMVLQGYYYALSQFCSIDNVFPYFLIRSNEFGAIMKDEKTDKYTETRDKGTTLANLNRSLCKSEFLKNKKLGERLGQAIKVIISYLTLFDQYRKSIIAKNPQQAIEEFEVFDQADLWKLTGLDRLEVAGQWVEQLIKIPSLVERDELLVVLFKIDIFINTQLIKIERWNPSETLPIAELKEQKAGSLLVDSCSLSNMEVIFEKQELDKKLKLLEQVFGGFSQGSRPHPELFFVARLLFIAWCQSSRALDVLANFNFEFSSELYFYCAQISKESAWLKNIQQQLEFYDKLSYNKDLNLFFNHIAKDIKALSSDTKLSSLEKLADYKTTAAEQEIAKILFKIHPQKELTYAQQLMAALKWPLALTKMPDPGTNQSLKSFYELGQKSEDPTVLRALLLCELLQSDLPNEIKKNL
ncbi:MAG: hypothetical protein JSR33_04230, partial [Proteobacteria bacterium]|nr:hypothetical protein [Pseudomonadota bacterium]